MFRFFLLFIPETAFFSTIASDQKCTLHISQSIEHHRTIPISKSCSATTVTPIPPRQLAILSRAKNTPRLLLHPDHLQANSTLHLLLHLDHHQANKLRALVHLVTSMLNRNNRSNSLSTTGPLQVATIHSLLHHISMKPPTEVCRDLNMIMSPTISRLVCHCAVSAFCWC